MLTRIQEDAPATQIVQAVDVLAAIRWLQEAWKEVTNLNIKNCFEKSNIKGDNELMEVDDLEFEVVIREFTTDISATKYANFYKNVSASEPMTNQFKIDWRQRVRKDSINVIHNPEIASDQVKDISNGGGSNKEDDELEQEGMGFKEIITMLDKVKRCPVFDDGKQNMLSTIMKRIEHL